MSRIPRPRADRRTCALCGRLADTGRHTVIGWVGPDCARKIEALPNVLERAGLTDLAEEGSMRFEAERRDGAWYYPEAIEKLRRRLQRAGLTVVTDSVDKAARPPIVTVRLEVTRGKSVTRACQQVAA